MKSLIDKRFWILTVVILISLLFVLFIIAVFFDFYNISIIDKNGGELPSIKGNVGVLGTPIQKTFNSFNAPWEYVGTPNSQCAINPVLVASGLKLGDVLKVSGITGNICGKKFPRPFNCFSDLDWGCNIIKACTSGFDDSDGTIKHIAIGFYNDQGNSHTFVSERALIDFQNGNIVVPSGANAAYAYFREYSTAPDYFDNNGGYKCIFSAEVVCTDTCNSLGYNCGTQTICGVSVDCGSCSGACNQCNANGQCAPKTAGVLCRASTGICDKAESCDGSSVWCPGDLFNFSTTICRASIGDCDLTEYCDGTTSICPNNTKKLDGTSCNTDLTQGRGICGDGVCIANCIPNCAGKQCGDDNCGGYCPPGCSGLTPTCNSTGQCVSGLDIYPPIISSILVSAITLNSATISWNTDEISNASVNYGTNSLNLNNSNSNSNMILSHSLSFSGLTNSTIYYYSIKSCDNFGNCATSGINNFTTTNTVDPNPPPPYPPVSVPPTQPPSTCAENWKCGNWSNCIKGVVKRICIDVNGCGTVLHQPMTIINCSSNNSLNGTGSYEIPAEDNNNLEIVYALEVLTVGFILIIITLLIIKYFNDRAYSTKKIDHKVKKIESKSKEKIKNIKLKNKKESSKNVKIAS